MPDEQEQQGPVPGHGDYSRALITVENARQALIDIAIDALAACDEVRLDTAVPDPNNVTNFLYATASSLAGDVGPISGLMQKMNKEWFEDWECQGWLEDGNSNAGASRSVASPCSVNPYCWFSAVVSFVVALSDAFDEIEEQCFAKNNGKTRQYGEVSSRLNPLGTPPRPRGRPKSAKPKPPPKHPKAGRPQKPRVITRSDGSSWTRSHQNPHSPFGRGRPRGSKNSPSSERSQKAKAARIERNKNKPHRKKKTRQRNTPPATQNQLFPPVVW